MGIQLCHNAAERQQQNFVPKIKKTQQNLNMWLQRDISLLSKAEGASRLVYPELYLYVKDFYRHQLITN